MRYRLLAVLLLIPALAYAERDHDLREKARTRIEKDRPNYVAVETIEFDGLKIHLKGSGTNPNAIANFVENIKADPMFTVPELDYVRQRPDTKPATYDFEMRFSIRE